MSQSDFVDALVADLERVRPAMPWSRAILVWVLMSWTIVGGVLLASGPLRSDLIAELLGSPGFVLELALGFAAGLTAIGAGLELGVPGAPSPLRLCTPPALLFCSWTLAVAYGLIDPGGPTTIEGIRVHCFVEILTVSLPPVTLAFYLLRGRVIFAQARAGLLVGAAAAALPALWMQLACVTEPSHVLKFHLSPILILGVLGALLARRILPRLGA
jgi:hypothetical protein